MRNVFAALKPHRHVTLLSQSKKMREENRLRHSSIAIFPNFLILFPPACMVKCHLQSMSSKSISIVYRFGPFLALYRAAIISFHVVKLTIWQFFVHDIKKRAVKFRETLIRLGPFYIKLRLALSTRPDILATIYCQELKLQGLYCSLRQLLEAGFFHADPHPGNLVATDGGALAYYDFGMMGETPRHYRVGLIQVEHAMVMRVVNGFRYLRPAIKLAPEVWTEMLIRMAVMPDVHKFTLEVVSSVFIHFKGKIPETTLVCISRLMQKMEKTRSSSEF